MRIREYADHEGLEVALMMDVNLIIANNILAIMKKHGKKQKQKFKKLLHSWQ